MSAARAARRAALKPYRKFSQTASVANVQKDLGCLVLSRLMLDTWAPFDA